MSYTTLVTSEVLETHVGDPDWVVVDCRFRLDDPGSGRADYEAAHIPGAVYAHLDDDLSGPVTSGKTGRHPLPDPSVFAERLGAWGVGDGVQVVAYDDAGGTIAARLWWMLRWMGHDDGAVLDGGFGAWTADSRDVRSGTEHATPRVFRSAPRHDLVVDAGQVAASARDPYCRVADARTADRYRGENETIDPVAGHIPGAVSVPYRGNLDEHGKFLAREELRARFAATLGPFDPERVVFYCGSGVTATHDVLAMMHAGLGEATLYPGSWSEWITDPSRGVVRGESIGLGRVSGQHSRPVGEWRLEHGE